MKPSFKKLDSSVQAACQLAELDAAVASVQSALGITAGDFAGQFFTDSHRSQWSGMENWSRYRLLANYAKQDMGLFA